MFTITFMAAISFSGIYLSFPLFTVPLPPPWSIVPGEWVGEEGRGLQVFLAFVPRQGNFREIIGVPERRKEEDLWTETTVFEKQENAQPWSPGRRPKSRSLVARAWLADGASQHPCKNLHPQASHGSRKTGAQGCPVTRTADVSMTTGVHVSLRTMCFSPNMLSTQGTSLKIQNLSKKACFSLLAPKWVLGVKSKSLIKKNIKKKSRYLSHTSLWTKMCPYVIPTLISQEAIKLSSSQLARCWMLSAHGMEPWPLKSQGLVWSSQPSLCFLGAFEDRDIRSYLRGSNCIDGWWCPGNGLLQNPSGSSTVQLGFWPTGPMGRRRRTEVQDRGVGEAESLLGIPGKAVSRRAPGSTSKNGKKLTSKYSNTDRHRDCHTEWS